MKRIAITIAITIATLAISTASFAGEDLDSYGSVLKDRVATSSSYNAPDTYIENHGSVLLDGIARNHGLPRTIERGLDHEISIGDAETLFDTDAESAF